MEMASRQVHSYDSVAARIRRSAMLTVVEEKRNDCSIQGNLPNNGRHV